MDFLDATFRAASRWRTGWSGSPRSTSATGRSTRCPRRSPIPTSLKRGAVVTDDDGRKHFAPVVRFKDEPSRPLYREPLLGEHTGGSGD